jgi:Na+-driven multidrug efflux pump
MQVLIESKAVSVYTKLLECKYFKEKMESVMKQFIRKYVGDKKFYRMVLLIAVPIMIQNGITNFVSLLDNIMVGQVGTNQMSGVAIANQLIFVYNLCIFGGMSGAGIFGAQFFGQGNNDGLRYVFRFKLVIGFVLTAICGVIFAMYGEPLISLYLDESNSALANAETLYYAKEYLRSGYYTISEIAEKCGFEDPNYFTRFFKKHTGLTPGEAKKQYFR